MKKPVRLRRRYTNDKYPLLVLRFEDGHEIPLKRGETKSFDAFEGEHIKVVALWDASVNERELIRSIKAEDFPEDTR